MILTVCGFAFFGIGFAYRRAGRPGKAMFDFMFGFSLFIVAYYLATEFH